MATCNDYNYSLIDSEVVDCLSDDDCVWHLISYSELRAEAYAEDLFESRRDDVAAFLNNDDWGWSDYELVLGLTRHLEIYAFFHICIGEIECEDDIEDALENALDELMTDEYAKYFNNKCDKLGIGH